MFGTVAEHVEFAVTATAVGLLEPELDSSNNALTLRLPVPSQAPLPSAEGPKTPPGQPLRGPTISGSAVVGRTLHATAATWSARPTRVSYQWQLCTARRCAPIAGATRRSLKLLARFAGRTVRIVATADLNGSAVKASSKRISVRKL